VIDDLIELIIYPSASLLTGGALGVCPLNVTTHDADNIFRTSYIKLIMLFIS
jgi:hypothetical protein